MSNPTMNNAVLLATYRDSRDSIFPSAGSLEWYLRKHKERLIDAGALLLLRGTWYARPEAFDAEVLKIAQEDARAWVQREQAA